MLLIEQVSDGEKDDHIAQLSTSGELEYNEKRKEFTLDRYPIQDMIEGFQGQNVRVKIELDGSVLSSRM